MRKFFKEFKAFITRGNVFDLAVGMIIATAFNKIVSSLVNDIIMPLITALTGSASVSELSLVLRVGEDGTELLWKYGSFLQYVIDFFIIALSVFIMVKIVVSSRQKFKELGEFVEAQSKKEVRAQKKACRQKAKEEGRPYKEVWAEFEAEQKRIADEKAKVAAEEKAKLEAEQKLLNPTQEELLKEIRDLLKETKKK
ncbi:MAG: large conductance mechanosensitive channel protein MscL [Clostridiales bacterium]|nr:large conductance mechanosensitive channel protein MscL [Clostridiales bacterium]